MQNEAPIVERSAPIVDARMEDRKGQTGAERLVSALQPAHRNAPRDRIREHPLGQRVELRALANPELADVQIPQDRERPTGMIVVVVRQREHLQSSTALIDERRNDDAIAGVELAVPRGPRVRKNEPAVRAADDDREPLSDVEKLDREGIRPGGRRTEMDRDGAQRKGEPKSTTEPVVGPPVRKIRGDEQRDVRERDDRVRPRHAEMPSRDHPGELGNEHEG
jgi:hypothetical protein